MKTKKPARNWLPLVASALLCCALNLRAQTPPTITAQPTNQTVLAGSNATFTVAVAGTGPFCYQWQFNGTNFITNLITTVAGGGWGYSGDGGPATNAGLEPFGVASDAAGNFYIADDGNARIRKVDTNGIITTVAGNGWSGYGGDGGAATNASLQFPMGDAVDAAGNLFIADKINDRIRKVATNGIITTIAGNGALAPSAGAFAGDGGPATNASLYYPEGVAVDSQGNVYIADLNNNVVRKVDTNGIITTFAGGGTNGLGDGGPAINAGLWNPAAVAVDARGNLYITDQSHYRIRKVDTNGIITTVAGDGGYGTYAGDGGPAIEASLDDPFGIALDAAGNLFIADSGDNRVRRVDTNGIITTVVGNGNSGYSSGPGSATTASLSSPSGVAVDAFDNLYIVVEAQVRKVSANINNGYPALVVANVSAYNAGSYTVVITGQAGSVTSAVATLTVQAPPAIADQPSVQFAVAGGNPAFSVGVVGSGPFEYSWYLNSTNLAESGTNSNLTLPDVAANEAGSYTVVVANTYGSVTSQVAGLILGSPPAVTLQPAAELVLAGSNAVFSVTVGGSAPFEYSWFFADTNLVQSGTNSTLTLAGVSTNQAGNYGVAVTNNFGSATSQVAALAVALPVIGVVPASQIVAPGSNAVFSETAVGSGPFDYFWYFDRTNLLQGGTNSTFTLTDAVTNNAGSYTVVVTNFCGSVTSQVASLVVGAAPVITVQPPCQMALAGSSPAFSVTAAGTPPFKYLWYFSMTNLVQSGATSTLTVAGVSTNQTGSYMVVVTNAYGSATSQVASLTVVPTMLSTQPFNVTVIPGTNFSFSTPVPGPGAYSYQWQFDGTNLPNTNFIITTVAGTNGAGYSGDGGAAVNAMLNYPYGVALDASANLYIADTSNKRIRKVDGNGNITTVAGAGNGVFSGDGGAATNAILSYVTGLVMDSCSNLYIADTNFNRIRKVDVNGIITTVAGTNVAGYSGDGGAAVNAELSGATGVAMDAVGGLYIADKGNSRIRKVDTNGIITTVAGTNAAGFSGDGGAAVNAALCSPSGVAVDAAGNVYIADTGNERIRKVATNGVITTFAGTNVGGYSGDGGAAANARLNGPIGVALDAVGNLYIADTGNERMRMVNTNGIITTLAGNGTPSYSGDGGAAMNAGLNRPAGVILDSAGNLYIADNYNNRIRRVDFSGYPTLALSNVVAGNAGSYTVVISNAYGSVTSAVVTLTIVYPPSILVQPASELVLAGSSPVFSVTAGGTGPFWYSWYLAGTNLVQSGTSSMLTLAGASTNDAGYYTVVVTNSWASVTSRVAALTVVPPSGPGGSQTVLAGANVTLAAGVAGPGALTCQWELNGTDIPNNFITTVAGNGYEYYGEGAYSGDGGAATNADLNRPEGVAFDGAGNLYIADTVNYRIRKVGTNGVITTVAGSGTSGFTGDGSKATNADLSWPCGVASDPAGNLYIADLFNNRVRKVGTNGIIATVAGSGPSLPKAGLYSGDGGPATNACINRPTGVALDGCGDLYIADSSNNCIRMVGTNGVITTIAGNGTSGFSGDGGKATNANLFHPSGVAVDAVGDLYIVDCNNQRIRKVDTNGIISTVAGNGVLAFSGDGGPAMSASLAFPASVAVDAYGNLYIDDSGNYRIRKVDTSGFITTFAGMDGCGYSGDGGPATEALLNYPDGVALDAAGNLYIADVSNQRIRKVYPAGTPTLTLSNVSYINAGSYTVVVSNAFGSATCAVGTLTVQSPPVVTVQPVSQIALAGSSPVFAVAAAGLGPFGYSWCFDSTNLVQSGAASTLALPGVTTNNAGNYTVVVTNAYGSVTSQVATLTVALPPSVANPPGGSTALAGANVTLNVTANGTGPFSYQWQFNGSNIANNIITTVAGNGSAAYAGDGGAATIASLQAPCGMVFDAAGNLYIADQNNSCIRKVDINGRITTVAGNGTNGFSGDGGMAVNANLSKPTAVAVDALGKLYVADIFNCCVRMVNTNGIITTVVGIAHNAGESGDGGPAANATLFFPSGVALDAASNLYITDTGTCTVRRVDSNGIITRLAGMGGQPQYSSELGDGGPADAAFLWNPSAIALDAIGNYYIADTGWQRIRMVAANGIINTVAGVGANVYAGDGGKATNAGLSQPSGVVLDASGDMFIADYGDNRIRKVNTNGIIATVAGNGSTNYSGDGGAATNAGISAAAAVALDGSGNLYIADSGNNRIREVHFGGLPALTLSNVAAGNVGSYSVVVSSPYGSVTSAVATVTVEAPPVITLQPANQTAPAGSSPTFSVTAAGSGTFEYLWYLAETNRVQSGRSSLLTLPNVFTNNAGSYSVVVLNPWGSVTSTVASLTVTIPSTPPQIATGDGCFGFMDSQFGFNLSGAYGQTIVVDGSTDLVNWTPLFTNTCVGDGGSAFYFWDACGTNFGSRFYRARVP